MRLVTEARSLRRDRSARIGIVVGSVRWLLGTAILAAICAVPARPAAQGADALVKGRALYATAAYTEALAVLAGLDTEEALQYRALCLMALGQTTEAERTIESLVVMAPTLVLDSAELPPRFASLLGSTRQRVVPRLAREAFAAGRSDFQRSDSAAAAVHFRRVLVLTAEPTTGDLPGMGDLRMLAQGFLDLTARATVADSSMPQPPAAAAAVPLPPAARAEEDQSGRPAADVSPSRSSPPAVLPAAAVQVASAPRDTASGSAAVPLVTPAVPVSQSFPPWPAGVPMRLGATGVVRVRIGADGRVTQAAMEVGLDLQYDQRLLAAARLWRFTPAMWQGQPIATTKLISFTVESPGR